jgi:hypothetical protein
MSSVNLITWTTRLLNRSASYISTDSMTLVAIDVAVFWAKFLALQLDRHRQRFELLLEDAMESPSRSLKIDAHAAAAAADDDVCTTC